MSNYQVVLLLDHLGGGKSSGLDVIVCVSGSPLGFHFVLQIENDPNEFALYCVHQSGGTLCHCLPEHD